MGRVLLVDGSALKDGMPSVFPRGAWRPIWDGDLLRKNPGDSNLWTGDRPSGVQRTWRRPLATYGAPHLLPSDVAEMGYPLRVAGRRGLFASRAGTSVVSNNGNLWNVSTWFTQTNVTITAGQLGPTGLSADSSQAYRIATTASGGKAGDFVNAVLLSLASNTYVWSCWVRRTSGSGTVRIEAEVSGQSKFIDYTLDTKWRRIWTTTPNVGANSCNWYLYPGGASGGGTIDVWGPQVELVSGAGAANAKVGRTPVVNYSTTGVAAMLTGPFAWPPGPWTLHIHWRALYQDDDGLNHVMFEATEAGAAVMKFSKNASNQMVFLVANAAGVNQTALKAATQAHETDRRLVAILGKDRSLKCYLNGVAFTTQIASPLAWMNRHPTSMSIGGTSGAGTQFLDGLLHRFELWDEEVEADRFF